ncbi:MAG: sialate O-acetylesterase [Verrucomicrobiota bacterium]
MKFWLGVCLVMSVAVLGRSAPRFAEVFSDGVVLQQEKPITVWGYGGEPKGVVGVQLGDERVSALANESGYWQVRFEPRKASSRPAELRLIDGGKVIDTVSDVLIGEVWLAAGQSNMQWTMAQVLKKLPDAWSWDEHQGMVRFRRVNDPVQKEKGFEDRWLGGEWKEPHDDFSAVASVFAAELAKELEVPVGVIDVSWGGKPIEPFIPRFQFERDALLKEIQTLSKSEELDTLAKLKGGVIIRNPEGRPAAIYKARMKPIENFALRGFLWYQGESNAGRGEDPREYRQKLVALADGGREAGGDAALPLQFVQLPSYQPATGWIRLREEQRLAREMIPYSGMTTIVDLPGDDIHPAYKVPVGQRLAQRTLADVYGKDFPAEPRLEGVKIANSKVTVTWQVDQLMVGDWQERKLVNGSNVAQVGYFEIAGEDGVWHKAGVAIGSESCQLVISHSEVLDPWMVRYGCVTEMEQGLLFDSVGQPLSPFCSKLEGLPWEDQK